MKKLLINAFLGAACLLSCVDASGMDQEVCKVIDSPEHQKAYHELISNLQKQQKETESEIELLKENAKAKIKDLIKTSGVDVKAIYKQKDKYGNVREQSALMNAVRCQDVEAVEVLLELGADVNMMVERWTPLTEAVAIGNIEIVKTLLAQSGIDINKSGAGSPALCHAASSKKLIDIFKLLMNRPDIKINGSPNDRGTALIHAVWSKNLSAVEMLLGKSDIDVNETEDKENLITALHYAVHRGNTDIIGLLLKHSKIDVNVQDGNGNTPLHWAMRIKDSGLGNSVVLLLLQHEKIHTNLRNKDGKTPLELARSILSDNDPRIKKLKEIGAQ